MADISYDKYKEITEPCASCEKVRVKEVWDYNNYSYKWYCLEQKCVHEKEETGD